MAFSIALIILLGLGGDYLFRRLKLPGLVGMLLVGVLVGPYVLNLISPATMAVSGDFRKIALIVILLRAGFELRRDTLNRVGRAALLMSAVPAIFEILGVMWVAPRSAGNQPAGCSAARFRSGRRFSGRRGAADDRFHGPRSGNRQRHTHAGPGGFVGG